MNKVTSLAFDPIMGELGQEFLPVLLQLLYQFPLARVLWRGEGEGAGAGAGKCTKYCYFPWKILAN